MVTGSSNTKPHLFVMFMYVCLQELHATIEDLQQLRITVCIVGAQVGVACSGCGMQWVWLILPLKCVKKCSSSIPVSLLFTDFLLV